jgi:hypothetical protein
MAWKNGLTACVTGGWGKKDRKRETVKGQNQLKKRAESQPSGAPPENENVLFPQRNRDATGVYCEVADT